MENMMLTAKILWRNGPSGEPYSCTFNHELSTVIHTTRGTHLVTVTIKATVIIVTLTVKCTFLIVFLIFVV